MSRNITLRQLKIFEAVARHLSYSRASTELHLTQPAVSTQIRLLEESAGLDLFEQLGKKVYLTAAGNEMLFHARQIIAQLQKAQQAMTDLKDVEGGTLSISAISTADYFFPRLLAEFKNRHPGVQLQLTSQNREQAINALLHNEIDLAIMARPPQAHELVTTAFAPHPYVVIAAPTHPLAQLKQISLQQLSEEPFIVREKGSDTWNSMKEYLLDNMPTYKIGMEIGSIEAIKQAVIAGLGLSFLSAYAVSLELQTGLLVALDVQDYPKVLQWHVVHHHDKRLPLVAQAFKSYLLEEGQALLQSFHQTSFSNS